MHARFSVSVLALLSALPLCSQITPSDIPSTIDSDLRQNGFGLYSASIFGAWFSSGQGQLLTLGTTNLPADGAYGGAASGGWTHGTAISNISVVYSFDYTARVRYSALNAMNHSLTIGSTHRLSPRLTENYNATAAISNLAHSLFQPGVYSQVAALPVSFGTFQNTVLNGSLSDASIASTLTGTPILDSPAQTLLFGTRFLEASMSNTLSYAYSQRTSLSVTLGATRLQHLSDNSGSQRVQQAYLLGDSLGENVSAHASHALTPRTHVGVAVAVRRISSRYVDALTTILTFDANRNMGIHWFVGGDIGVGDNQTLNSKKLNVSHGLAHYEAGGRLGYKAFANTLIASFDSTTSDTYGIGSSRSVFAQGSYNWAIPGGRWAFHSTASWNDFQGSILARTLSGWRAGAGLTRHISNHLSVDGQYYYRSNTGYFRGAAYDLQNNGVQVSLLWNPGRRGGLGLSQ